MKIEELNIGDKVRINYDHGIQLGSCGEIEFGTFLFTRKGTVGTVSRINNPFGRSVVEIIITIKENVEIILKEFPENIEKVEEKL